MVEQIVSVTRKGQATIPKEMRKRFGIGNRAMIVETEEGVLVKPLPAPSKDRGSLRSLFRGKTSREILIESRREELLQERRRLSISHKEERHNS